MDLKQIAYFVRVAELGSFTRASLTLAIAQPALSRQIRLLEVELRQNLLVRNGRGVTLTEAGRLMLEHGRGILHQVERAREDLGRARGAMAGRVTVGLPPSLARLLTVPLSRAFRTHLPDASLSITESLSMSMQEWLQNGRLDIALLYNPPTSPELESVHLMDDELFVVTPRADSGTHTPSSVAADAAMAPAIRLAALAQQPLVMPSRPNALRMLLERKMADIGCQPHIAMEIDGVPAILDLVSEGVGYAVLPGHSVQASAHPGHYLLHPITEPRVIGQVYLVTSARRASTLTQQAMVELIREQVAQLAPQGIQTAVAADGDL